MNHMIKSGGFFYFKGIQCTIGAVIQIKGRYYIATASHIFRSPGDRIMVESQEGIVKKFLEDFDIALIELPFICQAEVTELESAVSMEDALLVNQRHRVRCRITRAGASLLFLLFPCSDMPQPGDSGSPILQIQKNLNIYQTFTIDCESYVPGSTHCINTDATCRYGIKRCI